MEAANAEAQQALLDAQLAGAGGAAGYGHGGYAEELWANSQALLAEARKLKKVAATHRQTAYLAEQVVLEYEVAKISHLAWLRARQAERRREERSALAAMTEREALSEAARQRTRAEAAEMWTKQREMMLREEAETAIFAAREAQRTAAADAAARVERGLKCVCPAAPCPCHPHLHPHGGGGSVHTQVIIVHNTPKPPPRGPRPPPRRAYVAKQAVTNRWNRLFGPPPPPEPEEEPEPPEPEEPEVLEEEEPPEPEIEEEEEEEPPQPEEEEVPEEEPEPEPTPEPTPPPPTPPQKEEEVE